MRMSPCNFDYQPCTSLESMARDEPTLNQAQTGSIETPRYAPRLNAVPHHPDHPRALRTTTPSESYKPDSKISAIVTQHQHILPQTPRGSQGRRKSLELQERRGSTIDSRVLRVYTALHSGHEQGASSTYIYDQQERHLLGAFGPLGFIKGSDTCSIARLS